jgi:hypothetical protein
MEPEMDCRAQEYCRDTLREEQLEMLPLALAVMEADTSEEILSEPRMRQEGRRLLSLMVTEDEAVPTAPRKLERVKESE